MNRNRCRLVGAGTEGTESDCLLGAGFPFGMRIKFWGQIGAGGWQLHNILNILNTNELLTLKWLILVYVNFMSTKRAPDVL